VVAALFSGVLVLPASAVVFYATGDPHYNTSPPTGALAGSGWDLQGDAFPGVPIAPNFFITVTHAGGKVGDRFSFHGMPYTMIAAYPHPDADMTIWKVNGTFPQYAPLYSSGDEVGKPLVVFGRGLERGGEIWRNGILKGWSWGMSDGLLRWGENVVAGISDQNGKPATATSKFQLLRANFDANAGPNEADLSGGDSGGGVFIRDGNIWKLAGVSREANQNYSDTQIGNGFLATLFEEGGFFEGEEGKREYHPIDPSHPQPGSFYATRISTYVPWIAGIIGSANSNGSVSLQETFSLLGVYLPVESAIVDTASRIIAIQRPRGTRFYKVLGDRQYVIREMNQTASQVLISYE